MTEEMIGKKYGDLTVLSLAGFRITKSGYKCATVNVKCGCGANFVAIAKYVRSRSRKRCDTCQIKYRNERGMFRGMRIYS